MASKVRDKLSGISMPNATAEGLAGATEEFLSLMPKFTGKEGFKSRKDWETAVVNDQLLNNALTFGPVHELEFWLLPPGEEKEISRRVVPLDNRHEIFVSIQAKGKRNAINCIGYFNGRRTSARLQYPISDYECRHYSFKDQQEEVEKLWMQQIGKKYNDVLTGLTKGIQKANAKLQGKVQK